MQKFIYDQKMFDVVLPDFEVRDTQHLMQYLAKNVSFLSDLHEYDVYNRLMEQERVNPSAVGGGMFIAQVRLPKLKAPCKLFVRLSRPLTCDSLDGQPVDMVSLIISPESDGALHLRRLSEISRMFRENRFREMVRDADGLEAVKDLFTRYDMGEDMDRGRAVA